MAYAWNVKKAVAGNVPMALRDPYSDWERTNRVAGAQTSIVPKPLWQPVYVELAPVGGQTAEAAADALIVAEKTDANDLRFNEDTWWLLDKIRSGDAAAMAALAKAMPRFFVFRPEPVAHEAGIYPFKPLKIGPAIPFAFTDKVEHTDAGWDKPNRWFGESPVFTAVIDDQIGFANARFRQDETTTRIARLWVQGMPFQETFTQAPKQVIGREFLDEEINGLLGSLEFEDDIYRSIYAHGVPDMPPDPILAAQRVRQTNLIDPTHIRPYAFQAGHGTHVLDLAAGYPMENARQDRPILAVQIPTLATAETWGARLDLFVLLGVIRVLHWADTIAEGPDGKPKPMPVVLNISYGISAGPKDGTGFLEAEIRRLVKLRNATVKTVVVLPSGNGYRAHTHASLTVTKATPQSVQQRVQPEDRSVTFTEIWCDAGQGVTLTIMPPVGPASMPIPIDTDGTYNWSRDDITIGRIYVQPHGDTRRQVVFALCPTINYPDPAHCASAGAYTLTLGKTTPGDVTVMVDVQRDDTPSSFPQFGRQAYLDDAFVGVLDPETGNFAAPHATRSNVKWEGTLSAHASAIDDNVIVVGGAYDRHAFSPAALYSASAAMLPRKTPTLSAISEESRAHPGSVASGLFSGSVCTFSGTSMAAPRVARAIVDRMVKGEPYDTAALLTGGQMLAAPDARLGVGIMAFGVEPGRLARRIRG